MWKDLKPKVTKIVMLSIKNHWLILLVFATFMYLSGKSMAEPEELFFTVPRDLYFLIRKTHKLLGTLIFLSAIGLSLEKLYLYLNKKGKI